MKILTFNILKGGVDISGSRIHLIKEAIKNLEPDFVALQEAHCFKHDDFRLLKEVGGYSRLEFCALSHGLENKSNRDYHVAILSRYPLKKKEDFAEKFRNAALNAVIDCEFGEIAICNAHLNPMTEDERLSEIEIILRGQLEYGKQIILGDLNSLSPYDYYDPHITESFNQKQLMKFTKNAKLQYGVISRLLEAGYIDSAVHQGVNCINTVPTKNNFDIAHKLPLRLDYIFVSASLSHYIKDVKVIKTEITEEASDHYPVLLILG